MDEETRVFDYEEINAANIKETLISVCEDLEEREYDPIKQILGYLISGDPGYISSYKECRKRIMLLDRNAILEVVLKEFIGKKWDT